MTRRLNGEYGFNMAAKTPVKKPARKAKPKKRYHNSMNRKVRRYRQAGLNVDEIRQLLGLSTRTLKEWRKKYPTFESAFATNRVEELAARISNHGKYDPDYARQAVGLCMLGATQKDLAKVFDVDISCLEKWITEYPEFKSAILRGRDVADAEVALSLYKRATGYSHEAVHFATIDGQVVQTSYIKHYPPSDSSMIFWLKNRRPHQWRDRREVEIAEVENLTPWKTITAGLDD